MKLAGDKDQGFDTEGGRAHWLTASEEKSSLRMSKRLFLVLQEYERMEGKVSLIF